MGVVLEAGSVVLGEFGPGLEHQGRRGREELSDFSVELSVCEQPWWLQPAGELGCVRGAEVSSAAELKGPVPTVTAARSDSK